jgi:hypothetical protein
VTIRNLLLEHYLSWQKSLGEERTWKQFAEEIGIDHVYLNKIYNERRSAGEKTVTILAEHFGDLRFYDVVGMDRPDPELVKLRRAWGRLPDEEKKRIAEIAAPYIGRNDVPPTEDKAR